MKKIISLIMLATLFFVTVTPIHASEISTSIVESNESGSTNTGKSETVSTVNEENSVGVTGFDAQSLPLPVVPHQITQKDNISPQDIAIARATLQRVEGTKGTFVFNITLLSPEVITRLDYRLDWKDGTSVTSSADNVGRRWDDSWTNFYVTSGTYKPTITIQYYTKSGLHTQVGATPPNVAVVL